MTESRLASGALLEELSTFVGRRDELAEARAALGRTRLLTVLGPGGIGKTRFAKRLAHDVRKLYAGNVWFFDLSAVTAGGSVVDHVATNLNVQASSTDPAGEVADFFGEAPALLVMDGCEHVLDSASDLIRHLIETRPHIAIIATSQSTLRLSSEYVYVLGPLPVPSEHVPIEASAVQLFLDRVRDVMPDPSAAQLNDIAAICRRLDGIPLAVELAATRVRALTPRQIVERLDSPLAFLTRGDRDLPDRQRTLRTAIAWSYELCTDDERELWRMMSAFGGEWSLATAESMASSMRKDIDALDTVESLLEKSILRRGNDDGSVTYAMFETIRLFGLEISTPGERESALTAQRDLVLDRLIALEAEWFGPDQLYWLKLTQRALPNLRAAIQFSIDRGDADEAALLVGLGCRITWIAHGRGDELRRWSLRVLDMSAPPSAIRCQLLALVAALESSQGDLAAGRARLAEAAEAAEGEGIHDGVTLATIEGARGYMEPDPAVKVDAFERGLAVQGGANQVLTRIDLEERLADAHNRLGHAETANAMISSLVKRAGEAGDTYETSNLLFNAGITALGRDAFADATSRLRQALVLKQALGNPFGIAMALDALSLVSMKKRDYPRAATLLGAAQAFWGNEGITASPFSRTSVHRPEVEREARNMLGTRAFDAVFRRGQKMPAREAVQYALGVIAPTSAESRETEREIPLSRRELEVATLVAEGLSDGEIAARLSISRRTAEGHVAKSLMKLGLNSRTQLAAWRVRVTSGR
ncbi:ATP-binding protein [Leifsonia naganoensis]|uniref:Putative ATPase/DNA-binding CsgD family transcriptional regulator n=1 Tax=Leifsonia naganoensis TaxID=150025 RepID=A0A853DS88_9MICO|nr:LuxR C-terminal-related transcriptional regulator [Leifsonia naganoensis]NYK09474.1 putative ATPase/DNA-binding CsgD family transcriptional regulator [Leifsonia naganoensis]